ncbi:hypothetical protein C8Q75DRAFT_731014 [Abortiporus biennis]|nr:hypothetical protein C8Q75DRAFT_731014 [Abortiporus biennis]
MATHVYQRIRRLSSSLFNSNKEPDDPSKPPDPKRKHAKFLKRAASFSHHNSPPTLYRTVSKDQISRPSISSIHDYVDRVNVLPIAPQPLAEPDILDLPPLRNPPDRGPQSLLQIALDPVDPALRRLASQSSFLSKNSEPRSIVIGRPDSQLSRQTSQSSLRHEREASLMSSEYDPILRRNVDEGKISPLRLKEHARPLVTPTVNHVAHFEPQSARHMSPQQSGLVSQVQVQQDEDFRCWDKPTTVRRQGAMRRSPSSGNIMPPAAPPASVELSRAKAAALRACKSSATLKGPDQASKHSAVTTLSPEPLRSPAPPYSPVRPLNLRHKASSPLQHQVTRSSAATKGTIPFPTTTAARPTSPTHPYAQTSVPFDPFKRMLPENSTSVEATLHISHAPLPLKAEVHRGDNDSPSLRNRKSYKAEVVSSSDYADSVRTLRSPPPQVPKVDAKVKVYRDKHPAIYSPFAPIKTEKSPVQAPPQEYERSRSPPVRDLGQSQKDLKYPAEERHRHKHRHRHRVEDNAQATQEPTHREHRPRHLDADRSAEGSSTTRYEIIQPHRQRHPQRGNEKTSFENQREECLRQEDQLWQNFRIQKYL